MVKKKWKQPWICSGEVAGRGGGVVKKRLETQQQIFQSFAKGDDCLQKETTFMTFCLLLGCHSPFKMDCIYFYREKCSAP